MMATKSMKTIAVLLFCSRALAFRPSALPVRRPTQLRHLEATAPAVSGRRSFLASLSLGVSVAVLPSYSTLAADLSFDATGEVQYDDFLRLLFRDEVLKVQFYGAKGESAVATTRDGERLSVLGVPSENSNSPVSPLRTVAKVRDAGVPYSFESLDLKSFRKSPGLNPTLNPFSNIDTDAKSSEK